MKRLLLGAVLGSGVLLTGCAGTAVVHAASAPSDLPHPVPPFTVTSVEMVSPTAGWAWGWFGGSPLRIARTTNGGTTWESAASPALSPSRTQGGSVFFLNRSDGWTAAVVGPPGVGTTHQSVVVYRTRNGGRSWQRSFSERAPAILSGGGITTLDFTSASDGWMLGVSSGAMGRQPKILYRTTNGGAEWRIVSSGTGYLPNSHPEADAIPEEGSFNGLSFLTPSVGWIALDQSLHTPTYVALYRTTDGGAKWIRVFVPVPASLQNDYTVTEAPVFQKGKGTMVAYFGGTPESIVTYATSSGGARWSIASTLPGHLVAESFASPANGLTFTSPNPSADLTREFRTTDGGRTWASVPISPGILALVRKGWSASYLQMGTAQIGWLLMGYVSPTSTSNDRSALFRTTDGGRTWRLVGSSPSK